MSNPSDFVIENGILKRYKGPGGDVVIPESVTSIGYSAFSGCSSMTSVTIPKSVTSIGDWAFEYCSGLNAVYISDLSAWCRISFGCWKANPLDHANKLYLNGELLTDLVIPESVTSIGDRAFSRCDSLMNVTISDSVTSIGDWAFSSCSSLMSVAILEGVTSIGDSAFRGCSSLTSVTIPEGVTSIGGSAFYGCSSLTSVTIPDSVTSIVLNAFRGCTGLADSNGFVILRDILFEYFGPGGDVFVPDSVKAIGSVFVQNKELTSVTIPDSVVRIAGWAFSGCTGLTSVTIPESVTSIGDSVFSGCSSLTNVTLPAGVTHISRGLFAECTSLSNVTIPDSVTSIGDSAFSDCTSLSNVTIPEGVTSIGEQAFYACSSLKCLTIPDGVKSIGNEMFLDCGGPQWIRCPFVPKPSSMPGFSFALLLSGEKPTLRGYAAKTDRDNLSDFAVPGKWAQYDLELINNGPVYKYKLPARLLGAVGRLWDSVELTEENRALYAELLNKNAKKLLPLAEEMNCPAILRTLFDEGVLDEKTAKALRKQMAASANAEIAALAALETMPAAPKAEKAKAAPMSPLQAEYAAKLKAIKGDSVIKKMKLAGIAMPKVKLADGNEAPDELFRYLLASYGGDEYRIVPEADATAALLAYDSLCEALDAVSNHLDVPAYPALLPLLCRYGNVQQIKALINAWKGWGNWEKYGQKGRAAQERFKAALAYSDTHEAVVWLEKNVDLMGFAQLRGLTVADVYEQYLFDFGFDVQGKKTYDLGVTTVEASIDRELTLSLYDTVNKKKLRGIPKKGIDPAIQKKASDDLADLRANLKKAVKIKTDQLFADYLSGKAVPAEAWQKSYLRNPLLRAVAALLVWAQGDACFTLGESGPLDSAGQPYTITDEAIRIAHPMEMQAAELAAWQKYYITHGLKQPFAQVWEPVYEQSEIREDRYKDCPIHSYYLKNQEKRGINVEWWENEYSCMHHFKITGFDVKADGDYDEQGKLELEILSLHPHEWNRRTNTVIAYLDRITVFDRVKKDDVSVMNQMQRFTLAQITEYIKLAQESNAVNVLALLLEYKNAHFADFDPMDEFTLEW